MSHYFRTLFLALRGVDLIRTETFVSVVTQQNLERDRLVRERNKHRDDYVALLAECKRHRDATWRITHSQP